MTRNEIITELYKTQFVEKYAAMFMSEADRINKQDIIQDLYLMVCELNPERLCAIYDSGKINGVRRFVAGLIIRQMRSDHSEIYRRYTRRVYKELPTGSVHEFRNIANDTDLWQRTTAIRFPRRLEIDSERG